MITWIKASLSTPVPIHYDCLLLMHNGDVHIGRPISGMRIIGWSVANRPDWISHNHTGVVSGSSARRGQQHHNSKLTDEDCELIRALADEGIGLKTIAEKFEAGRSTIKDIVTYRTRYVSSDG